MSLLASRSGLAMALALAAMAGLSTPAWAQGATQSRTPDIACAPGQPSLTVEVSGFANAQGIVRAQLYGPGAARFLDKGQWAMRIEQARRGDGPMRFCFPIAQAGKYAVAVRHDANGNGKSDWNDGGGFTRNPTLSLLRLKPAFAATAVEVDKHPVTAQVVMQYRRGLSIAPLKR